MTAAAAPVWLDLDQAALDAAYTQSAFAPNMAEVLQRYASSSDAARAVVGEPQRLAYGPADMEQLDIYRCRQADAPVVVFIHGGAWRSGRARDYAFGAPLLVQAGAHLVVPDFSAVQDVQGDLTPMADQVQRAVAWVYRHAASFGADARRIHLLGHSSGAHLVAVALTTDWQADFDVPADVVKSALCCSGLYDLAPVRLSVRSSYVAFTDAMEAALSPQRHLGCITAPVMVAYGTRETPEFQRQAKDFAAALAASGHRLELMVGDGLNHFEIIETLAQADGVVGRALLAQLGLPPLRTSVSREFLDQTPLRRAI